MRALKAVWVGLALLAAPGCVVREIEQVPPGAEIVEGVPPAAQVEVVPLAPSAAHLWMPGHWVWRHGWIWEPGRYELRRQGYLWHPGHWMRHRHGYVWVEGHWGRA